MARITITTDQGKVVEVLDRDDIGDLTKPLARAHVISEIADAVHRADHDVTD